MVRSVSVTSGQTSRGGEASRADAVATTLPMRAERTTKARTLDGVGYTAVVLRPGSRIDAYELVALVGEGGMAQVWVARRKGVHGFEKLFAVKVVHARLEDKPRFHAMFLDEAKIAADIQHPNVAQVFDLGEHDGMLYLAMEYVDGESLSSLARGLEASGVENGILPLDVSLRIAREACAGLEAAHTARDAQGRPRGIVHRDVSPQNILLGVRGEVKLIDFGIAFAAHREAGVTRDGTVRGKLQFMAPEQVRREPVGPQADVFGIGATLYAMLVGFAPFAAETELATLQRLVSSEPARIPERLPRAVRDVLARALALDVAERYPSAAALGAAVEEAAHELGVTRVDLAAWVSASLSPRARALREHLAEGPRPSAPEVGAAAPLELGTKDVVAVSGNTKAWERFYPAPVVPELGVDTGEPPNARSRASRGSAGAIELDHGKSVGGTDALRLAPVPRVSEPFAGSTASVPPTAARAPAAPPSPPPQEPSREFFDVAALAARASSPEDDAVAPARAADVTPARRVERPASRPRPAPPLQRALVAVALAGLVVAIVVVALPLWIRHRVTETARAAGLTVTMERVSVALTGVTFRGVAVRAVEVPGLSVRIEEATTRGFSAEEVHLSDVQVDVTGPAVEVAAGLARASARVAEESAVSDPRAPQKPPRHLIVSRARIAWSGVLGEGTGLAAEGVALELDERVGRVVDTGRPVLGAPPGVVLRATSDRAKVTTARGTLGPWGLSAQLDGASNRLRVLFDPALPDGPSALWTWGPSTPEQLTIRTPRVPLATLGIPPELVGLAPGSSPDVEAQLESKLTPVGRVDAHGKLDVRQAKLPGGVPAFDLRVEGSATGSPGKPLELERTSVTVGSLVASLTGTVEVSLAGARVDATWRLVPIPCANLVRREAESLGPLAVALQDLGDATGVARVTGTAQASGTLLLDTGSPTPALLRAKTRDTCGVRLFGR